MTKPNWRKWVLMKKVKVWEACVLSVGLEPESMEFEDERWNEHKPRTGPHIESESFPSPQIEKDYKDLVEVLVANLLEGEHFDINEIGDINNPRGKKYYTVRLDEFVRWATLNVHWLDLPPELAGLILDKKNEGSKQTEVNPSTENEIALVGNGQAAGGPLRALANSKNSEISTMGLIGQKGRQAKNNKRLSHINATNRLGDDEKKIIFGSLKEAQTSIVLRYDALQATNRACK